MAEEIFFGEASTGPSGDLAGATRLAAQMVGSYGMAGSLISLDASRGPVDIVTKVLSDESCRKSVEELLESARSGAREVLASHQHVTVALRDALLERDELVGDEITAVIAAAVRQRPAESVPKPPRHSRRAAGASGRYPAPTGSRPVVDIRS